ncbi:MAG: hypothetical protein Q9188_001063 [Gyalolechia gomerana]
MELAEVVEMDVEGSEIKAEVDEELDVVVELPLVVGIEEVLDTVDEVTVDELPVYPQIGAVHATPALAGATITLGVSCICDEPKGKIGIATILAVVVTSNVYKVLRGRTRRRLVTAEISLSNSGSGPAQKGEDATPVHETSRFQESIEKLPDGKWYSWYIKASVF